MAVWPAKDPDEELDYGFDWSPRDLGNDAIATTMAIVVDGGVTVVAHAVDELEDVTSGFGTKTRLSGGDPGGTAHVLLKATTNTGQKLEETMSIKIKPR